MSYRGFFDLRVANGTKSSLKFRPGQQIVTALILHQLLFEAVNFLSYNRTKCFISLGAACQTQNVATQNVATQEINEKVITPSPTQSKLRIRDDSKRLINAAGWELPDITLFKEVSRERYKTNKSIARIEQIDYIPLVDVIQYADGNTAFDVDRDPTLENKAWLIRRMKVFSAQGRPFCYVMRGDWVEVDENGKIKARAAMTIVLVYTDQDGDGIYETFQYSAGEMPIIPERLMKH